MKNSDLALRVKELRSNLGYSQADLAGHARLSLRTVQRIENGETEPRGDTLIRLSQALAVSPQDLMQREEEPNKLVLILLVLSALSFIIFPLLGVIVPLIIWSVQKDKIQNLNSEGKKLLNFEITMLLLSAMFYVAGIFSAISHTNLVAWMPLNGVNSFQVFMIVFFSLYVLNVVILVANSIRIRYALQTRYFLAIPFLK